MRKLALCCLAAVAVLVLPGEGRAHTGGPLDADGCHTDHRTGEYHCHRGPAAGCSFADRAAMLEAVRTGNFPEKTVEEDGFFSKMWPFGKHRDEEVGDASTTSSPSDATTAPADAKAPPAATDAGAATGAVRKQQEFEERLKVLQGLYEMGLITKEEYEAKRKAVLDQL